MHQEGGTEPTIALLYRLAAALNTDVRLTPEHDLDSVWFETHAAHPSRNAGAPGARTADRRGALS